jgi:hypothetical protein
MKRICKFTLSVLIITFGAVAIFGQATGGAVTGSVSDANGAVVPNATVKLTDKVRGQEFNAQTRSAAIPLRSRLRDSVP